MDDASWGTATRTPATRTPPNRLDGIAYVALLTGAGALAASLFRSGMYFVVEVCIVHDTPYPHHHPQYCIARPHCNKQLPRLLLHPPNKQWNRLVVQYQQKHLIGNPQ